MKLIDDLLDVSRIAAGKIFLDMQPLDLRGVVEAALEVVRPSAQAKNVALEVHANTLLPVQGDGARLKQVIWNLLSNAIKFTPSGGRVEVDAHIRGAEAAVVIRDSGEGIDPRFLPHVFQPFRQADSSTSRRHGGLGIGLSIVASLVASHNGNVRADSAGLGKGATFTVTIPLLQHTSVAAKDVATPYAAENRIEGARIVIVDDDAAARNVMKAALTGAGADVRECVNAVEAYDAVTQWRPNIVISDLAMPNEDGYSLIRRIRDNGIAIPAVAITAYARSEDQAKVREAGFQRHVSKPFDPAELVRVVRELAG
jgi:CheY-like chemotaxis protein/anti-sigma regulatory factor (Ser/Thr protein kinase)